MNQPTTSAYVPGVCNINRKEIANRRMIGYVGLAVSLVLLITLIALSLSRYYRLIIFVPAVISASGFLQAKNRFCVGYAGAGQHNAEEGSDAAVKITDESALAKDKSKSSRINRQSFAIALAATAIALLIPEL